MKKYGLTSIDLKNAQYKINEQKKYLIDNEFVTSNCQVKNLLDVSFSANHSERYYSQLANKINTMEQIAYNECLEPIFMTITLDGFYRDLLKGNYNRFDEFDDDKVTEIFRSIPNNDIRGYVQNKIKNKESLTIKDLYNILNHQLHNFKKSYSFKKMNKNNDKFIYIKSVEPHSDGVPHFHILFYAKKSYKSYLERDFYKSFPAPRNKQKMKNSSETYGFQTSINKPSAYILKYITKSFMDVKNQKELDYIQAWYIKHRIMRCVTSRTLVPQWVFKKLILLEKDWYYLTDIINAVNADFYWSEEDDSIYIKDTYSDCEYIYTCGLAQYYSRGIKLKEIGTYVRKVKYDIFQKVPNKWKKKKTQVPIFTDGKLTHIYFNNKFNIYNKHISNMNDFELTEFHNNYDIDNDPYIYYLAIKNLMIDRGLLHGQKYNLNNFDISSFLLNEN